MSPHLTKKFNCLLLTMCQVFDCWKTVSLKLYMTSLKQKMRGGTKYRHLVLKI